MASAIYTTGEYLALHPTWHMEDSAWKAEQVLRMLKRNGLQPEKLCEIGCGAGGILAELQASLDDRCELRGYEISPQAYALCQERANPKLQFVLGNYFDEPAEDADVMLVMDVVEHIEDYLGFLKKLRGRARFIMLHVPLDLSLQSILRHTPEKVRRSAGHLHYFTKEIFLDAMRDCGYDIVDWNYTGAAVERPSRSLAMAIAKWPRKAVFHLSPDLATLALGGYSLLVLAQ